MKSKKVTWNGFVYSSQRELARHLKRNESTVRRWIKSDFRGNREGEWLWEGRIYSSASEISRDFPCKNKKPAWYRNQIKNGHHSFING